ncbi:MAG: dienelactone hydrolase family protein [Acidobacteriota bacterium]
MIIEQSVEQTIKMHYDLYVPEREDATQPLPLLIALHGYEGNKESMMNLAQKINAEDCIIASLQAPNGFFIREGSEGGMPRIGFGWMMTYKSPETISLHHRTVTAMIEKIAEEYPINRQQIFLLAFSQSCSLNYRFAFTHPNQIRGVVAVCGGIPGDWQEDKYQKSDTDILIIAGESDEFYPIERVRTFQPAMQMRAGRVDFQSFPVGHIFMREALPVINHWLLERINQR